jgi:mono/diheme cytochrome c family protein
MMRARLCHGEWIRPRALLALALLATVAEPAAADSPGPRFSADFLHFSEQGGELLYRSICAACHQPNGAGAQGAGRYPALAGNPALASADYVLHNVLHGRNGMPGFAANLDDRQVADVVNYVRGGLGNRFVGIVSVEQVKAVR